MKKIFVTGASGFIGSYLVRHLLAEGHEVTALVRSPPTRPLPPTVTVVTGDITRAETYAEALPGQDAVYHLAASYRIGLVRAQERSQMFKTNVTGALALLEAAYGAGVPHLIYASTTAALGETHGQKPDETHRHNGTFRSAYEETKHIAHELLRARQSQGMPLCLAILGGVFGRGDTSVLASTVSAFFQGKIPFQVASESRFQLCPVERVSDALVRLLDPRTIGQSYLITGQDFSMPEIFSLLSEESGRPLLPQRSRSLLRPLAWGMDWLARMGLGMPLSSEALRIMDGSTYTYAATKIERELGWQAGEVKQALRQYIAESQGAESQATPPGFTGPLGSAPPAP